MVIMHYRDGPMIPAKLGDTLKHLWLVRRMAKSSGVDVAKAQQDGTLDQALWNDMIHTCRHCQWTQGCGRHLQRAATGAPVPNNCLNKSQLDALKTAGP